MEIREIKPSDQPPEDDIFELYNAIIVGASDRTGVSIEKFVNFVAPFTIRIELDPDDEDGDFGSRHEETISVVLRSFTVMSDESTTCPAISLTFDHALPLDLSTLSSQDFTQAASIFIADTASGLGDAESFSDDIVSPKDKVTFVDVLSALEFLTPFEFCETQPEQARKFFALIRKYILPNWDTGLYENNEHEYTIICDSDTPRLIHKQRRYFESEANIAVASAVLYVNGALQQSVDLYDSMKPVATNQDNPIIKNIFDEIIASMEEEGRQIADGYAEAQLRTDIHAVYGLLGTWLQPQRCLHL